VNIGTSQSTSHWSDWKFVRIKHWIQLKKLCNFYVNSEQEKSKIRLNYFFVHTGKLNTQVANAQQTVTVHD